MKIIGHGIDIIEIAHVARILERSGNHFEVRCFTSAERLQANESGTNRIQYLAGRFAAKEAVLKALSTGWGQGISWTDVEIQRLQSGCPSVVLYGKCEEVATKLGVAIWLVSISHTESYVVASAIAIGTTNNC